MSDQSGERDRMPSALPPAESNRSATLRQAGVVHDVNQMLAVILGRAELLLQHERSGSRREDLEAITLAAGDAAAMLERLREGLPPRQGVGSDVATNLDQAVQEVVLLIRPAATGNWTSPTAEPPERSWVLELEVGEDLYTSVPEQVVREVLGNLVANSLEVLPEGGRVRIEAAAEGRRLEVTVKDNGPGLDKETARLIFEPGFTSSGEPFRGIGLAVSRQLLKCFDGRLDLGPDQREGAQFRLDLPRVEPVRTETDTEREVTSQQEAGPRSLAVLVVDDESAVRDMLSDVLKEMGCRVTAVRDAMAAVNRFRPGEFHLALVDQSLPGRSGQALAAELRDLDPSLAVTLITGWGQEEVLDAVDPAIVDMTATKPLKWTRISELLDQGERLNRQRRASGSGPMVKG